MKVSKFIPSKLYDFLNKYDEELIEEDNDEL